MQQDDILLTIQEVETEFGELADKLARHMVQMIANRLEAAVRAAEDFDIEKYRAGIMEVFAEHRQKHPRPEAETKSGAG